jgi:outer membrane murein-binding lipoprotein Lpp
MTNDEARMPNQCRMSKPEVSSFGPRHSFVILASAFGIACAGCFGKPNQANIALRKEIQTLNDKVASLTHERDAAVAQARASESGRAVQTLPVDRLEKLFTASGIRFGRVLVGNDTDSSRPGDEGLKVSLTPVDQFGDDFKSAGSFTIECFDLAADPARIGRWTIETADAQQRWLSTPVIDAYVFELPWQTVPTRARLMVKATFVDELTGRTFDVQREVTINVPTAPATQETK